jgi:acylphosphatase
VVSEAAAQRLTVWLHGRVQGVGMRWWVRSRALELGLAGSARNTDVGRVEVVAEGPRESLEELLRLLAGDTPDGRPGRIDTVVERWAAVAGELSGFVER